MIFKTFFAIFAVVALQVSFFDTSVFADDHKSSAKIKVLLVDGQNNHDWKRCSPVMIDTLLATGRFEIERAIVTKEGHGFHSSFVKIDVLEKTEKFFLKHLLL